LCMDTPYDELLINPKTGKRESTGKEESASRNVHKEDR